MHFITASQCRAARALLNWSQPELAQRCGMHVQTVSAYESDVRIPSKRTLEKTTMTFESSGIEFLPHDGVRRRIRDVITYDGVPGFEAFIADVYQTVKSVGGDICVSNVNEKDFDKHVSWGGAPHHLKKMAELKKCMDFSFRILVKEGDMYFPASDYAEYRWINSKYFRTVPFYVYGDKLAIINFQKGATVHVVESKEIADAQRIQFNLFWESAKIPK
jgi:transcriptional regulator with XRE-family HTH domain